MQFGAKFNEFSGSMNCSPQFQSFLNPINFEFRCFKFEPAVGSSTTWLIFIKFGPRCRWLFFWTMNSDIRLQRYRASVQFQYKNVKSIKSFWFKDSYHRSWDCWKPVGFNVSLPRIQEYYFIRTQGRTKRNSQGFRFVTVFVSLLQCLYLFYSVCISFTVFVSLLQCLYLF